MANTAGVHPQTRLLRRPHQGRWVAGVAAGLAEYLEVDVVVVRIALVAAAAVGGVGIPLYLAAWLLVPDEDAEESVAEHLLSHVGVAGGWSQRLCARTTGDPAARTDAGPPGGPPGGPAGGPTAGGDTRAT